MTFPNPPLGSIKIAVALLSVAASLAAQGEGNGRDLVLNTSIDSAEMTEAFKNYQTGSFLTVNLQSPGGTLNGMPALIALDLRARTDNNVIVLPNEPLALGIGLNFLFLMEGTGSAPAVFPGNYGVPANVVIPIPDLAILGPISIYLQGTTFDAGAVNGLAFTRTIRHDIQFLPTSSSVSGASFGSNAYMSYGLAVADLNGDGFDDLACGAPSADPAGAANGGMARIFWGPNQTTTTTLQASPAQANAYFGGLIRAGDVTNDGIIDLIVAARLEDVSGAADAGAVYVFPGPSFAAPIRVPSPANEAGARFGNGLSIADYNRDGIKDLVVGAPRATSGGIPQAGRVFVFNGGSLGFQVAIDHPTPIAGDKFGYQVLGGDFSGDTFDDIWVGCPGKEAGASADSGAIYRFETTSALPTHSWLHPADSGAAIGNGFTTADFNRDGIPDIACTTEFGDSAVGDSGRVLVFYGPSYSSPTPVDPPSPTVAGGFGSGVATGDFNGDRYPDLIVGEFYVDLSGQANAGQAWTFLGPHFRQPKLLQNPAPYSNGEFGRRVAAGDVNGDGFDDAVVGAPFSSVGGVSPVRAGYAMIWK